MAPWQIKRDLQLLPLPLRRKKKALQNYIQFCWKWTFETTTTYRAYFLLPILLTNCKTPVQSLLHLDQSGTFASSKSSNSTACVVQMLMRIPAIRSSATLSHKTHKIFVCLYSNPCNLQQSDSEKRVDVVVLLVVVTFCLPTHSEVYVQSRSDRRRESKTKAFMPITNWN